MIFEESAITEQLHHTMPDWIVCVHLSYLIVFISHTWSLHSCTKQHFHRDNDSNKAMMAFPALSSSVLIWVHTYEHCVLCPRIPHCNIFLEHVRTYIHPFCPSKDTGNRTTKPVEELPSNGLLVNSWRHPHETMGGWGGVHWASYWGFSKSQW